MIDSIMDQYLQPKFENTIMKYIYSVCLLLFVVISDAQTALPSKTFLSLRDSTTSMDIVMLRGKGGSLSAEGRSVPLFINFFDNKTAPKTNAPKAGMIMWLQNGREFLSGDYYLGDSTGYVIFKKDGQEFVNRINAQGNAFFKGQMK